jgi:hypothetical protein
MQNTKNPHDVNSAWVAQAAARAEALSRKKWGGDIQTAGTPLSRAHSQLQRLIGAIMDDRITRRELRRIAQSVAEGRS